MKVVWEIFIISVVTSLARALRRSSCNPSYPQSRWLEFGFPLQPLVCSVQFETQLIFLLLHICELLSQSLDLLPLDLALAQDFGASHKVVAGHKLCHLFDAFRDVVSLVC